MPLAALALVLGGCGGGDSSADPQQVLDDAFAGGTGADSGVLDLTLDIESSGGQEGSVDGSLQGPFQSNGDGALPSLDLDLTAAIDSGGGGFDFDGGLTLTTEGAWVNLQGQDFELDDALFSELQASYEQAAMESQGDDSQGSLEQFGIDPAGWLEDLTNEGTEDLDGTEVVHVSGTANVPGIISDLSDVAEQTGQADELDPNDLEALEGTVSDASIDVYAATDDGSFRRLELELQLADPRGGDGEVTVDLAVGLSEVGEEQSISGPSDALPLSDLLSQIPGGLGAIEGLDIGGDSIADPGPTPQVSGEVDKYYDCVAEAQSAQEIDDCAAQLSPSAVP